MDVIQTSLSVTEIHKELDLIQSCINRMANNSFLIKGWMITLTAALVALLADKVEVYIIAGLATVVIFCFWYLDGFFLKMERLFRAKYEWVIINRPKGSKEHLYDLKPNNSQMWLDPKMKPIIIPRMMFTKTLIPFYGVPFIIAVAALMWSLFFSCSPLATP